MGNSIPRPTEWTGPALNGWTVSGFYAYATGVLSSRGIARKLEEDVAFRVLAAGNFPQHRTICEFRRRHLDDFKQLFVEVVGLARELGLARFGKLSVDGTKVRANASKRKAMSYGRMQEEERRLSGEIDELLRAADDADVAEDVRLGVDVRGDELPAALRRREDRVAAIRAAKARLAAAQRAADPASPWLLAEADAGFTGDIPADADVEP